MTRTKNLFTTLLFTLIALLGFATTAVAETPAAATKADIQKTLGFVPQFFQRLPEGMLPGTWDETAVLPGSRIGEVAVFARRKGGEWFIAVLNGPEARTLRVDLKFLAPGNYSSMLVHDDPDNPAAERIERPALTPQGSLTINLRAGGGFIGRLTPSARRSRSN